MIDKYIKRIQAIGFFITKRTTGDKYWMRFRVFEGNHVVYFVFRNNEKKVRYKNIVTQRWETFEDFFSGLCDDKKEAVIYNMDLFV